MVKYMRVIDMDLKCPYYLNYFVFLCSLNEGHVQRSGRSL
jgi:hypothetical protein